MIENLRNVTSLDEKRCCYVLEKVNWLSVGHAIDYLFDRDQDGIIFKHAFCTNINYEAPNIAEPD